MDTAQRLFERAFAPETHREPRSEPYRQGVLDALRFRAGTGPSLKELARYAEGSAERDAWLSGADEGRRIWKSHQEGDK